MSIPSKKRFYEYMSSLYGKYNNTDGYRTFKEIFNKADDIEMLDELFEMTGWNKQQRLHYRYALACMGKELTPIQVDQYISIIEYAMNHIDL